MWACGCSGGSLNEMGLGESLMKVNFNRSVGQVSAQCRRKLGFFKEKAEKYLNY